MQMPKKQNHNQNYATSFRQPSRMFSSKNNNEIIPKIKA